MYRLVSLLILLSLLACNRHNNKHKPLEDRRMDSLLISCGQFQSIIESSTILCGTTLKNCLAFRNSKDSLLLTEIITKKTIALYASHQSCSNCVIELLEICANKAKECGVELRIVYLSDIPDFRSFIAFSKRFGVKLEGYYCRPSDPPLLMPNYARPILMLLKPNLEIEIAIAAFQGQTTISSFFINEAIRRLLST